MRASYCGHTDVVQALLVADVNINQQENVIQILILVCIELC